MAMAEVLVTPLPAAPARLSPPRKVLKFGGGDIFFWWMAGAMKELCHRGSLTEKYVLQGASAGALAAVLGACQIPTDKALDLAHSLTLESWVFQRPWGLVGVWGSILRTWLHTLLPDDAHHRCSGRVEVVVTEVQLPRLRRVTVSEFGSKDELIEACLASAHVLFLIDGKFPTNFKGSDSHTSNAVALFLWQAFKSTTSPHK